MSIASEVRRISREALVTVAELLYASGGEGLFRVGVVGGCRGPKVLWVGVEDPN